ncbi:hypothetical protein BYT27DRAFT_7229175 [Phlegmacium glaucopus]|nr:hypothetical protein BYT27DRAFT_7229175 [Phlegmacium glaucopus]
MDSPWDESGDNTFQDVEWSRISSEFTNVGYREGITAGKESALQEGFDAGFADIGAPIGRELGILRGISSAILVLLRSTGVQDQESIQTEAQEISSQLSKIRFSDIMPRDLEAEEHARQHLEEGIEVDVHEKIAAKRDIEAIEDMLTNLAAGTNPTGTARPSVDDVRILKDRLKVLSDFLNLQID